MEEIVCLGNVSYFEIRAVPEELLAAVANAEGAQEDRFCERTGEVKIGAGRRTAFASFQPFFVMADGARKCFGRTLVFPVAAFRNETGPLAAPTGDEHLARVPYEDDAVFGVEMTLIFLQFVGARWQQPAIVPMHRDRGQVTTRRKLVVNDGSEGDGFFEDRSRTGLHTLRRAESQGREDRRQVVNAHVTKTA